MKINDLFENWGLKKLKLNAKIFEMEFERLAGLKGVECSRFSTSLE